MRVSFNFNLAAQFSGVEVEGASYEDALDNLHNMTLDELVELGAVENSTTEGEEGTIADKSIEVLVTDIEYDINQDDLADGVTEEETIRTLPDALSLTIDCITDCDDEVELIKEYTEDTVGTFIKSFNYKIVKEF